MCGGGEGLNYLPCLKVVRIILETTNLARKYTHTHTHTHTHTRTHTCVVSENIPFSTEALLILLISAFFYNKSVLLGQNSIFTQSNSVRAALDIF